MGKIKCSKEDFYKEIERIYKIENRINVNIFNKHTKLDIGYVYYVNKFGGIKSICNELGLEYLYYNQASKEELINRANDLYNKHGYINKDLCCENNISSSAVRNAFGSYNNLFKILNIDLNMPRFVTEEELLEDIKDFNLKYSSVSSTKYRKLGKYSCTIINKYGGWRKMLDKLNIKPLYRNFVKEYMVEKVKKIYDEYGFITKDLVNDNTDFTYQAFSSYFKNKKEMSEALGCKNAFKSGRSQSEKIISKILNEIIGEDNYIEEMTWNWLKNKKNRRNMYCDFYIPKLNLVIEYNGKQHYMFVERFHVTEEKYQEQIYRDNLKAKLLREHNVKLEIIRYDQKVTYELINNIIKKYNNS